MALRTLFSGGRKLLRLAFFGIILAMLAQPFFSVPNPAALSQDVSPAAVLCRHVPQFLPTRSLLMRLFPKWKIHLDNPMVLHSSDLQSIVLGTIDDASRWCQTQGVVMKRSAVGSFWTAAGRSKDGALTQIYRFFDLSSHDAAAQTALHVCWLAFFIGVLIALWSPFLLMSSILGLVFLAYVAQVPGPVSAIQSPLWTVYSMAATLYWFP